MSFPPDLLDELAQVFARVALDRLLQESAAREPRQENAEESSKSPSPKDPRIDDEKKHG